MKKLMVALVLVGVCVMAGCSKCNKCKVSTPCGGCPESAPCVNCDK